MISILKCKAIFPGRNYNTTKKQPVKVFRIPLNPEVVGKGSSIKQLNTWDERQPVKVF